jgi:hypothetical protein
MRSTADDLEIAAQLQTRPSGYARSSLWVCFPRVILKFARGSQTNARLAVVAGEWLASRPDRFTPGERASDTHWIVSWTGLRAGLGEVKRKFLTLLGFGRPARSQSLYQLLYPGSLIGYRLYKIFNCFQSNSPASVKPNLGLLCRSTPSQVSIRKQFKSSVELYWGLDVNVMVVRALDLNR